PPSTRPPPRPSFRFGPSASRSTADPASKPTRAAALFLPATRTSPVSPSTAVTPLAPCAPVDNAPAIHPPDVPPAAYANPRPSPAPRPPPSHAPPAPGALHAPSLSLANQTSSTISPSSVCFYLAALPPRPATSPAPGPDTQQKPQTPSRSPSVVAQT